jgi:hypothetical protein
MKTNFLYFREKGKQVFTYSSGAQTFEINGNDNWDTDVTEDTQVKVTVTDVSEGTDTVIPDNGKSISGNVITIAASGDNGFDLVANDIVTIELIPNLLKHQACFRADRFIGITPTTAQRTTVSFKAGENDNYDDTVKFYHSDDDGVSYRKIANYFADVMSGQAANKDGFIVVADRANNVIARELQDVGITKMEVFVQS